MIEEVPRTPLKPNVVEVLPFGIKLLQYGYKPLLRGLLGGGVDRALQLFACHHRFKAMVLDALLP